ncbi:glycosyltransferase family 4 protein [Desulfurococcaceae archaeon MEX13E-LK6-19]|nr:glycosyltransferase family 4 protein [Desulfurococcaceae archaeon MEX13E-LK6-19]
MMHGEVMVMKIAIMGRWNATCGVSLHAELIGRKLIELGHKIVVFAPTLSSADKDWHHRHIDVEDEPWVHRVFEETDEYSYPFGGKINAVEIFKEDFDVFIVEAYNRFPVEEFKKIAKRIRKRAPLILITHLGYIRDTEPLMEIEWDAIVVFDKRFIDEIIKFFGEKIVRKTVIIPYPYAIINDVLPRRPDFAKGKILFITYGRQPIVEYLDYIRVLRKLKKKYDFVYWIIRSDGKIPFNEKWIIQTVMRPDIRTIYSLVMGADIHLLPKGETRAVVLSSTLNQILYAGTPTVVPDTRYFEYIQVNGDGIGPVVKYPLGNTIDLYEKIVALIENDELREYVSREAKKLALKYSDEVVAKMFIELFNVVLEKPASIPSIFYRYRAH